MVKFFLHILESTKSYCWLTALGLIPLTLFAFFHIKKFWDKRQVKHGQFINATGFGIYIGISCIYDCNNLGLPISFGLITLISLIILIIIYFTYYFHMIVSIFLLLIGIGISIGYYIICVGVVRVSDTDRIGFLISMIGNIVIFVAIGVGEVFWGYKHSCSDNFYAANWMVFIITAPVTALTALAIVLALLLLFLYLEANKE